MTSSARLASAAYARSVLATKRAARAANLRLLSYARSVLATKRASVPSRSALEAERLGLDWMKGGAL